MDVAARAPSPKRAMRIRWCPSLDEASKPSSSSSSSSSARRPSYSDDDSPDVPDSEDDLAAEEAAVAQILTSATGDEELGGLFWVKL